MATVTVRTPAGAEAGTVELADEVFGVQPHVPVMHQVVVAQLAARRAGTQSTKTRSEVRGGGAKPFRQKGTGRARAGSIRAPHWTGGGVALGPKPRSYAQRTPKKMIKLALRSALSDRASEGKVVVVDGWGWDAPKTASAKAALSALELDGRILVVLGETEADTAAALSFRNLPEVQLLYRERAERLRRALQRLDRLHQRDASGSQGSERMKDPRDVIIEPVVSEKSYALLEGQRLHVHRPSVGEQARDPRRRRVDLQREGAEGEHAEPQGEAQAQPASEHLRDASQHQASDRHPARATSASSCSRAESENLMALRKRKPTSPGRRFQTVSDFSEITKDRPEKSLLAPKPRTGGRNSYGRKTARHRGGGHKQQYRIIDFKRTKDGVPAKVAAIEYDPNRNCRIALLHYYDGEKRYILAPNRVGVGEVLQSGQGSEIKPGNALPLRYIPVGTVIHNVEFKPGAGGKMARSAGSSVQLVAKEGDFATLRLPSTEMRRVPIDCRATVGEVGNAEAELIKIGKAGRNRWKGVRPQTRGVAMNPVDHPLGGGEGKTSGGRHPVSPWGKPEGRTRDKTKPSQKLIVRRRRTRGSRR